MRFSLVCCVLAAALETTGARAAANLGTLSGTVTAPNGAAIGGATVVVTGPANRTTASDARGAFSVALPPGEYRVEVTKGGFAPAVVDEVTIFTGESHPLAIEMRPAGLNSLLSIAAVRSTRGTSLNTTAAAASYVPGQAFANLANPQINDVLQRQPDAVIQRMGSQPDTSIVLGGVQPYETQVLIDGHPISMGQYGVWLSEYFNAFLVAGIETQTGPGNTTPFAATVVGGTANILTPGFTQTPTVDATIGSDSYQSQFSNLLVSGSEGKLQYVAGAGYGSNNGPYFQTDHCVFLPQNPGYSNTPQSAGIVQFCGDASGSLFTKGEVAKVRYNFSQVTSLDLGFVGSQGGFLPQGTAYGQYIGPTKVLGCYNAPNYKPATPLCTNPADSDLIGKTIPGYLWYPGSNVYSNQPIFTAQLRSTLGDVTVLDRPYAGNIERIVDGAAENGFPYAYGIPGKQFETYCNAGFNHHLYEVVVADGLQECQQSQFSELERDRLYGNTLSLARPFGESQLTFTWDYHGDNTFAYYNTPSQIATPNTTERYNTVSLVGDLAAARNLRVEAGLYDTTWRLAGSQPQPGASPPAPLVGLTRSTSRFDLHVGLIYQPHGNVVYRAAFGTSETYPFANQVSGEPQLTPNSATFPGGFVTEKNAFLNPETSTAFDAGGDVRLRDGSTVSLDATRTEIYDVFENLTQPNAIAVPGQPIGLALIRPINAAELTAQMLAVRYNNQPRTGIGYYGALAVESSQVNGIPASFYLGAAKCVPGYTTFCGVLPANGQQICGFGQATPGTPTCIPYLKGYGQISYAFRNGAYAGLGMDFEGKNNAYFQPPFVQLDLTLRNPVTELMDVAVSVQNLLNTNNFFNLPQPGAGVTTVVGVKGGVLSQSPSSMIPAPPRTVRVQLHWHFAGGHARP